MADLICRPDPFAGTRRGSCDARPVGSPSVAAVCGSLDEAASREWLVTDGLGGYACGTVAGPAHAPLPRAAGRARQRRRAPPGWLGLAALDTVVVVGDQRIRLATHEWVRRCGRPARARAPAPSFDLDDGVPRWRYDLGAVQLEVEVAMTHGVSAVGVVHRLLAGRGAPGGDPAVHVA